MTNNPIFPKDKIFDQICHEKDTKNDKYMKRCSILFVTHQEIKIEGTINYCLTIHNCYLQIKQQYQMQMTVWKIWNSHTFLRRLQNGKTTWENCQFLTKLNTFYPVTQKFYS